MSKEMEFSWDLALEHPVLTKEDVATLFSYENTQILFVAGKEHSVQRGLEYRHSGVELQESKKIARRRLLSIEKSLKRIAAQLSKGDEYLNECLAEAARSAKPRKAAGSRRFQARGKFSRDIDQAMKVCSKAQKVVAHDLLLDTPGHFSRDLAINNLLARAVLLWIVETGAFPGRSRSNLGKFGPHVMSIIAMMPREDDPRYTDEAIINRVWRVLGAAPREEALEVAERVRRFGASTHPALEE